MHLNLKSRRYSRVFGQFCIRININNGYYKIRVIFRVALMQRKRVESLTMCMVYIYTTNERIVGFRFVRFRNENFNLTNEPYERPELKVEYLDSQK